MKQIFLSFLFVLATASLAFGQVRSSKIGYLHPAGGRRGTTFEVLVGGRQIAKCTGVIVSGTGVRGQVLRGYSQMGIVGSDDSRVARFLYDEAKNRIETPGARTESVLEAVQRKIGEEIRKHKEKFNEPLALANPEQVVKRHPYLSGLLEPDVGALQTVFYEFYAPRPVRRPPEAIGQGLRVKITIDADAEPGDRDLRLLGPAGLSPPVRFVVGTMPEVMEIEPNDAGDVTEIWGQRSNAPQSVRQLKTLDFPVVINGQIRAGDIDRFTFRAAKGQRLVLGVRARHLVPYLADGVPGWFEAVLSLFGPDGRKIAEASSYRHDPDPLLTVEIPKNGVYTIEIRDSVFRGREDFTYRISVGEAPLVTSVFPLGGRNVSSTGADLDGWNLPEKVAVLDTQGKKGVFEKKFLGETWLPYPIRYVADDLPERLEPEPNGQSEKAPRIELPVVVNGRIESANDVDCFSFNGRKGEAVVLDVTARSLDSPLDAGLELLDAAGNVIARSDDRAGCEGPNIGLETHHADPYLSLRLPEEGVYTARLYDVTRQGGPAYAYRLRVSPPRPDFSVYCEPGSVSFSDNAQPLKIHLVRQDGFDGEVRLVVRHENFRLDEARIPADADHGTATLTALPGYDGKPVELHLEAIAVIDGKEISRAVIPVDDWEQAFIYHHLVPADSLMVVRIRGRRDVTANDLTPKGSAVPERNDFDRIVEIGKKQAAQTIKPAPSKAEKNIPADGNPFAASKHFKVQNRIDILFLESLKGRKIEPAVICSDEVFIRRVYLDLLGTLPTAEEVRTFLEDNDKQKRRKLIDNLLARPEFVDFQTMRWCDLLRVKAEFPINLWPNGASCYYRWIRQSVDENKPYDRFVRELLTANGSNFRDGAANFYRAVPSKDADTLAETVCRTFLGIDIGPWPEEKRKPLVRFFSRVAYKETAQWKEEIVYWDRKPLDSDRAVFPDGKSVVVDPDRDPRQAFVDWLVSPENASFNRCIANRIWIWLFGGGLVPEPEDAKANQPPVHPELLDYLCNELVKSKYDLKHLYRLVLNSGTYQQSSIPKSDDPDAAAVFASYPVRRIEAEVLQDALARIFDLPVGYVSEVPEPFTYIPPRYRTILLPDSGITSSFLEMFGRASRDTGTESDRNGDVTESQLLFFLNSTEVNDWISQYLRKYRNLEKRPGVYESMLDELWLTFLSRYPTENELRIAAGELRRQGKTGSQKMQDIIWSLLNTMEFSCKH